MKFKAHNCKVIDTRHAMVSDGRGGFKLREGGMKQTTIRRKVVNYVPKHRAFVR